MESMKLVLPAYAKLNLTLDVLGRRDDGYHEIASVMQTISMHDLLAIERAPAWSFEATGLSITGENLVVKAARLLEALAGRPLPLRVRLHKRIPIGAGLGGGSSDAATFLRAAVKLYSLRVPAADLLALAVSLGQDVAFFLPGGTALATGMGSQIELLPPFPSEWAFVVACPAIQVSTRDVYAGVDGTAPSAGRTPALVAALRSGSLLSVEVFGNDLERATQNRYPEVERASAQVRALAPESRMTGSGAALFIACSSIEAARVRLTTLRDCSYPLWLCRPVSTWS